MEYNGLLLIRKNETIPSSRTWMFIFEIFSNSVFVCKLCLLYFYVTIKATLMYMLMKV